MRICGRPNKTKPVIYPMIQLVIVSLYTKYELSILYSRGDTFDEKCGEKEKRTYARKKKQETAGFQSHDATSHCQFTYKILSFYHEQMLRNLLRNIAVVIGEKEKITNVRKNKQDKAGYLSHDTTCRCYSVYQI